MQNKVFHFADPVAQFKSHEQDILEAIGRVCKNGPYILGNEVAQFEAEFSEYMNMPHTVGVGSGTDALSLALRAYDIGAGDEVITVSHTALATAAAIYHTGATPVLVDINPLTYTMDANLLESALTPKTKAVIAVHIYGNPCDMDKICSFAKKHNLTLIEDCAQAHGATYNGTKVGAIAETSCFSFYPTKNLGAIGDGGAVVTRDPMINDRIRQMRQYGWNEQRISQRPGFVSRLDEIQAAILRVKLKTLNQSNTKRNEVAKHYDHALSKHGYQLPKTEEKSTHAYHLYVIQSDARDLLKQKWMSLGVNAGIHYTHPVHLHPGYREIIKIAPTGLAVTETIINRILSLPMYPELSGSPDLNKILEIVSKK